MDLVLDGSNCYIKAHCFFGVRRAKEFEVLKWSVNIRVFVLFLIAKCVSYSISVETNLFPAIKLQPDLINRAILQVTSTLRKKLKIEIKSKNSIETQQYDSGNGATMYKRNSPWQTLCLGVILLLENSFERGYFNL